MTVSLNTLEIALLTRAALNPAPKKTWASYKRSQRARQAARTPDGKMLVSAETIQRALLDAVADAIRQGNHNLTVTDIVAMASQRFPIPVIAEAAIRTRLAARKPAQPQGGHDHD